MGGIMSAVVELIQNAGLLALLSYALASLKLTWGTAQSLSYSKLAAGVAYGIMCSAVMIDPITIPFGATFDPRAGPAILAGVFAGPEGALVANAIGAITRYFVVGGHVAAGGAFGFALYGLYGWLVGRWLIARSIRISTPLLALIGGGGTLIVLPSFFISADLSHGLEILKSAWPLLLTANVLGTLVVGLVSQHATDTSGLSQKLAEKNRENELLGLALRAANPVVITDRSGITEWVNEGFTRLTGYSREEILGRKPGHLLQGADTDVRTVNMMREALEKGEGFDVKIVNYTNQGNPYWAQVSCSPIKMAGQTFKFVAIQNDITGQIEAEAHLRDAKEEAESANHAKSEFLATMSHELRTPLNAILGFGQLLEIGASKNLESKQQEYVGHILASGEHLLQLINDILDLSQIEADRLPLRMVSFDPSGVVIDCEEKLAPLALKHGVSIKRPTERQDCSIVKADEFRFRQIVINLLSNAIKYNRPGGEVRIELKIVTPGYQRISVIDNGPGISPQKHHLLFKNFSRVSSTAAVAGSGVGLGLAVVKMLAHRMAGRTGFSSEPDVGSTFWFEIPLAENHLVLVWDDSLRVGIDPIDSDHQKILARINNLSEEILVDESFSRELDELIDFIEHHFYREEVIMNVCKYPEMESHSQRHREFLADLTKARASLHADPSHDRRREMRAMLCSWWQSHISGSDKDIGNYAEGKESSLQKLLDLHG